MIEMHLSLHQSRSRVVAMFQNQNNGEVRKRPRNELTTARIRLWRNLLHANSLARRYAFRIKPKSFCRRETLAAQYGVVTLRKPLHQISGYCHRNGLLHLPVRAMASRPRARIRLSGQLRICSSYLIRRVEYSSPLSTSASMHYEAVARTYIWPRRKATHSSSLDTKG